MEPREPEQAGPSVVLPALVAGGAVFGMLAMGGVALFSLGGGGSREEEGDDPSTPS
ncbi:MAG: hypothetical protein H6736_10150 [Alphaproteobacteria bacterium]|nr:hypothetical protein [Alphaproteobacteria bacterium]